MNDLASEVLKQLRSDDGPTSLCLHLGFQRHYEAAQIVVITPVVKDGKTTHKIHVQHDHRIDEDDPITNIDLSLRGALQLALVDALAKGHCGVTGSVFKRSPDSDGALFSTHVPFRDTSDVKASEESCLATLEKLVWSLSL